MNYLKGLLVREEDEEGQQQQQQQQQQEPVVEELSPDELRRRRMARFQNTTAPAAAPAAPAPASAAAPPKQEEEEEAALPAKRVQVGPNTTTSPAPAPATSKPAPDAPSLAQKRAHPSSSSSSSSNTPTNQALVLLLRISLAPRSAVPQVMCLPAVAEEFGGGDQVLLSSDTLDAALCARLYVDPNDYVPRPTESPLAYILGCFQRLPGVQSQFSRDAEVQASIAQAKQLLVNFAVTYLVEPSLFPSSCLAKSASTGPCAPEQEAVDLLKRQDAQGSAFLDLLVCVLPEVTAQQCGKEIALTWLTSLSQEQRQFRDRNVELALAQLCRARAGKQGGWGRFVAEALKDEREKFVPTAAAASAGAVGVFRHLHQAQAPSFGAKFEQESLLAPFFASIGVSFEPDNNNDDDTQPIRQSVVDAKRATASARCETLSSAVLDMCRTDDFTRQEMLQWMERALELNEERAKDRPHNAKCSSDSLVFSLTFVLLKLCEPFVVDEDKATQTLPLLVHEVPDFIFNGCKAFPPGVTRLGKGEAAPAAAASSKVKFQPRVFALALRAVNLGPMAAVHRLQMMNRSYQHFRHQMGEADVQVRQLGRQMTALVAATFEPVLLRLLVQFESLVSRWMGQLLTMESSSEWKQVPEFVLSDMSSLLIELGRMDLPSAPASSSLLLDEHAATLQHVSDLFVLAIPLDKQVVAHVRALMGDALFWAFLPEDAHQLDQDRHHRHHHRRSAFAASRERCLESPAARTGLVPALMKLYGDVAATSFYEVSAHRQLITKLLAYLWKLPEHRAAFESFAATSSSSSSEDSAFIQLANGILNQTNSNVAESLAKLREIRKIQQEQKSAQWTNGDLSEEDKNQRLVLLESHEGDVKAHLAMANDATDMLSYLSTDAAFVRAFTVPTLRSRLVDMLGSILGSLGSRKNAEFKIDHPERYNFYPKRMLQEIFETLLNCSQGGDRGEFVESVARSAYFNRDTFANAEQLVRKHGMVSDPTAMDRFAAFADECQLAKQRLEQEDEELGDVPDEFLDPLMATLMRDPVKLPGSKVTVDRDTIVHHLLQNANDPFDRSPLELSQVVPDEEVRDKIAQWREKRRRGKQE